MAHLKTYQIICGIFPPIFSQKIREKIFPLEKARSLKLDFSKTSITGSRFMGNTSDDHSYRFAVHGFFDWRNIIIAHIYSKYFKGDIVEVGANVGTETISYCDLISPKWKVHAFEPLPENISSLHILAQSIKNIIVYPKAISNKSDIMHFQIPPKHESGIGKIVDYANIEIPTETFKVETATLNSYIDKFENLCLISIDTEGHEPFVLDGASDVLDKFRPAVIIEVSPKLLRKYADSSPEKILKFFRNRNYLCLSINRYDLNPIGEESLHSTKSQNWFCIPSEKQRIIKELRRTLFLRAFVPWYFLRSLKGRAIH